MAEVHQGLGPVAGTIVGHQRSGQPAQLRLGGGQGRLDGEQPGHDPLDIAVDDIGGAAEGYGGDGGGRMAPTPAGPAVGLRIREHAAMVVRHGAGAGQQVAGAGVVAEAGQAAMTSLSSAAARSLTVGQRPVKVWK